ncbi:MAG: hypothetical protein HN795_01705, partial [Flavobacteriaceae bacterium]|nr:hypothetical protein [Flavobacteriaceae bacterium]
MKNNIYWKKNIRYISILLSLWFIISFGCGRQTPAPSNEIQKLVENIRNP